MRLSRLLCFSLLFTSSAVLADSKNPADTPMRIHIFNRSETTFYHNRFAEEAKGEGRANLFANGDVRGVDFTFDCKWRVGSWHGRTPRRCMTAAGAAAVSVPISSGT